MLQEYVSDLVHLGKWAGNCQDLPSYTYCASGGAFIHWLLTPFSRCAHESLMLTYECKTDSSRCSHTCTKPSASVVLSSIWINYLPYPQFLDVIRDRTPSIQSYTFASFEILPFLSGRGDYCKSQNRIVGHDCFSLTHISFLSRKQSAWLTYKEKTFTLVHGFSSYSSWSGGPIAFRHLVVVLGGSGGEYMSEQNAHLMARK